MAPPDADAELANRTLVVIELAGGNDGLATLVPTNAGPLYDRRPSVHIPDEEQIEFTPAFGWNPNLAALTAHPVAALVGVGTGVEPDGSHFEMERRWWTGESSGRDLPTTGFLGRLCDQLETDQPVTGISLGTRATPALMSAQATTVGVSEPGSAWFLEDEDAWFSSLRRGLGAMAVGADVGGGLGAARSGLADTLAFADIMRSVDLEENRGRFPETTLGWQLSMASHLIAHETGLRVFHLTHANFDTHTDQRGTHDYLLMELGEALGAFLSDQADRGRAGSTLVATTSEFGRRVSDNDGGTDHGAASTALLAGPVTAGVHGEPPSITSLDDGNLRATVDFESYYATIAEEWFGVPATDVLDSGTPISGVIIT